MTTERKDFSPYIRDAATLVLVRRDRGDARILMGRRASGHRFMPDKWVFPGGAVDRADYGVPIVRPLPPETRTTVAATARLRRQNGPRLARALALAAIRETFEETGLILGQAHGGEGKSGAWEPFFARGYAPDPGSLSYIGRAITPPARVRRYDARFFLADATSLVNLDASESPELNRVGWFTLAEIEELDLARITRHIMQTVAGHIAGDPPPAPPFWRLERGKFLSSPLP